VVLRCQITCISSSHRVGADAMKDVHFEIIATNLSEDQEQKLREACGQG